MRILLCLLAFLVASPALAQQGGTCQSDEATADFRRGFAAQKDGRSTDALGAYKACLAREEGCVPCWYEIGWSYWTRGAWDKTVEAWEKVTALQPGHPDVGTWLVQARQNAQRARTTGAESLRVTMGTKSVPEAAPIKLQLVARFQNYDSQADDTAGDHHDQDIYSPKSVRFSADGSKAWVNSLEGMRTVVYETATPAKTGVIRHDFDEADAPLFQDLTTVFGHRFYKNSRSGDPNHFRGKPVESALSPDGKWLYVPYYRRDWDGGGTSPSAVAVIDTTTDTIVRVLPTGPIPKYVSVSADGKWLAITHWGDNTVALIDTSSGDPAQYAYSGDLLVVEKRLSQAGLAGEDRDKECGYCLRGTVFAPDGKTLLVARMGGGGIAGFDLDSREYLGTSRPTSRATCRGSRRRRCSRVCGAQRASGSRWRAGMPPTWAPAPAPSTRAQTTAGSSPPSTRPPRSWSWTQRP
jgi:hypothetical protein